MKITKQDIKFIMAMAIATLIHAPSKNNFNNIQQTINNYGIMKLNNYNNFQNNESIKSDAKADTKVSSKKLENNVKPLKKITTQHSVKCK